MSEAERCPQCGGRLTAGSAEGLCPRCLLTAALRQPAETAPENLPEPGSQIGSCRILRLLGEGGMGLVYLAEQEEPIARQVALKIIKLGMDTRAVLGRFQSEQQALALMDHPNIAQVYEAGSNAQGRPYFVMEYVPGVPITQYCDRHRLGTRQRLELFLQIANAVQHAHLKGVIHRDLKPSNVLVMERDGEAVPKIIDFGLAKATEKHLTEETLFTEAGVLIGTPEYMSPEQASLGKVSVDTRTDIYSLGVLLYELLVGAGPFDSKALRSAGYDEIRRIIREEDPPTPAARLLALGAKAAEIAQCRATEAGALRKQVRGELDWITMKALEKDCARRYPLSSEMAADVQHYLRGEAVTAGPAGVAYRLRKFAWRHRTILAACAAALFLVAGAVVTTALYRRNAAEGSGIGITRLTGSGNVRNLAISPNGRYIAYTGDGLRIRELASGVERQLVAQKPSDPYTVAFSPDSNLIYYGAGIFARGLSRIGVGGGPPESLAVGEASWRISFSPDGRHFVSPQVEESRPGESALMLFDATARERKVLVRWSEPDRLDLAAWSPSGDVIACAIEGPEETRLVVVPVSGGAPRPLGAGRWLSISGMAWRDRSSLLVAGSAPDAFWFTPVWHVTYPQGEVRRITPDVGAYDSVTVAANQVVAVKRETSVEVFLPREGRSFSVSSAGEVAFDLAWTPGGDLLYNSDVTGKLEIWSAGPVGENRRQLTHGAGANLLSSVCGGGQHIIFASNRTGDLRLWRMDPDGGNPRVLTGPVSEFADCSPDGRWVVYADQEGTWRISVDGGQPQRLTTEILASPSFSPDGTLVAGYRSGQIKVLRSTGGQVIRSLPANLRWFSSMRWSPDGRGIDYVKDDIWRVPLSGGPAVRLSGPSCPGCTAFAWSRDGKRLACARIIETRDVVLISGIP